MAKFNKKALERLLEKRVLTVSFTKANGENRVMSCTLQSHMLPSIIVTEGVEPRQPLKENPKVLTVYDTKAKGWRSFRMDSIISIGVDEINEIH